MSRRARRLAALVALLAVTGSGTALADGLGGAASPATQGDIVCVYLPGVVYDCQGDVLEGPVGDLTGPDGALEGGVLGTAKRALKRR